MSHERPEDKDRKPQPPRQPVPPLPPNFNLLESVPAAPPQPPAPSNPMMDFLSRRLESLEKELAAERTRAQAAQNMLEHQEALRGEVEAHLKAMSEQIRREKNERDSAEMKSHAQGRVDALEKRLDDMHQTWAGLLKEAIAQREQASARAPDIEKRLGQMLAQFSDALREEQARERSGAQKNLQAQLEELRARLEESKRAQDMAPKAKDQLLSNLEQENRDLAKSLKESGEALHKYLLERRQIEQTMGQTLMELHGELTAEREKVKDLERQMAHLELEPRALKDKLRLLEERHASLSEEKNGLGRLLLDEAAKVREQIQAREESERSWIKKIEEMQALLKKETDGRLNESAAVAGLRAQIETLSREMTKAVREKDAVLSEYSDWEKERKQLAETLKKKEELVAMLSSTFQDLLRKP